MGYSSWGLKESDMTEHIQMHTEEHESIKKGVDTKKFRGVFLKEMISLLSLQNRNCDHYPAEISFTALVEKLFHTFHLL